MTRKGKLQQISLVGFKVIGGGLGHMDRQFSRRQIGDKLIWRVTVRAGTTRGTLWGEVLQGTSFCVDEQGGWYERIRKGSDSKPHSLLVRQLGA